MVCSKDQLLKDELRNYLQELFIEEPDLPVWKWCEENIILTELETDYPGYLDTDLTPWIRDLLEWVRDDVVEDITVVAGTQVVKTIFAICAIAWWYQHRGTRGLMAMDSESNAADFSETRLKPIFERSKKLKRLIPSNKNKWTKLRLYIGRGILNLIGSNSPGKAASRPAPFLVMDEIDKYKRQTKQESDMVSLIESRDKAKSRRKRLKMSSPTTTFGLIWRSYLRGSKHVWMDPCPHCGKFFEFVAAGLRWCPLAKRGNEWDMEWVKESAFYECPHCKARIVDSDKRKMNRLGKWIPTNPNAPKNRISCRISSFYSVWESCTFGNIAVQWMMDKADFNLKNFDNNWAGLPSEEDVKKMEWEKLADRREPSPHIPEKAAFLTAAQDTQDSWLEWMVIAWGENLEQWVVEHERIVVDPSDIENWETTRLYIERDRATKSGRPVPLLWVNLDFGGHQQDVLVEFYRSMRAYPVHLCFGSTIQNLPARGRKTKTKSKPRVPLFEVGVSNAKRRIFSFLTRQKIGRGYVHFLAAAIGPDGERGALDDEFFRGLCAEHLESVTVGRQVQDVWVQDRDRNEPFDLFVYCYHGMLQVPEARRVAAINTMRKATQVKEVASPEKKDPAPAVEKVPENLNKKPPRPRPSRRRGRGGFATDI